MEGHVHVREAETVVPCHQCIALLGLRLLERSSLCMVLVQGSLRQLLSIIRTGAHHRPFATGTRTLGISSCIRVYTWKAELDTHYCAAGPPSTKSCEWAEWPETCI